MQDDVSSLVDQVSSWLLDGINTEELAMSNGASTYATNSDSQAYADYSEYSKYSKYSNYSNSYHNYSNYSDSYHNYSNYSNSSSSYLTGPDSQTITLGDSVTFTVTPKYTFLFSNYQWYKASSSTGTGTAISGATSSSYTFTPTSSDNGMYYYCVASGYSHATSSRALLTVNYFKAVAIKVCVGKKLSVGFAKLPSTTTISSATSSNTSVATVDSSGNVTGVSAGTATITLTASNGLSSAISVNVLSSSSINELSTVFFNIAEAIRAKKNITSKLYPNQMPNALNGNVSSASYSSLGALFTAIANNARTITGSSDSILPANIYKAICDSITV